MEHSNINRIQELAGLWSLACDPLNLGKEEKWFEAEIIEGSQDAPVPGIIQQVFPDYHGVVWYRHSFMPDIFYSDNNEYILKFGFVDYFAEFWLNGNYVGSHEGGEMPFEFDVTNNLKTDKINILDLRLINPVDTPLDGFILNETPHRNKMPRGISFGSLFNYGGIIYPVQLVSVPKIRILNVFSKADYKTGEIENVIVLSNNTASIAQCMINISVCAKSSGETILSITEEICLSPGETTLKKTVMIHRPKLWSLDDPYLYRINAELIAFKTESSSAHNYSVCCGFRDFCVEKGFFRINGKRIFVKSTHTGNHYPIGQIVPTEKRFLFQDLIYAKASGFNMVRFIAGVAFPEQLDFCDEIGLLVYEECASSWLLKNSPKMLERFDIPTLEMIKRDRNHPSVVIWGLLNEENMGPVAEHAIGFLPKIREIDETRLVLLNSGRWDRRIDVGSISNPRSYEWEFEWGDEAINSVEVSEINENRHDNDTPNACADKMGDLHLYPVEPRSDKINCLLRSLGNGTKPIFLSECGVGSLTNCIRTAHFYEQTDARPDLPDALVYKTMTEKLTTDWEKFGLDGVYSFVENMLRDSERLQSKQREYVFSYVRSNPQICGYNLTGMLDHAFCGEGLWSFFREWKPGIVDVLQNGWANLRWCLFVNPMHVYAGRSFKVEAVLANEDVLKPGNYPVCFKISSKHGIVWQKRTLVHIPEPKDGEECPLATPCLSEDIVLDVESGTYELTAYMEQGGAPAGGRITFHITNACDFPKISGPVTLLGLNEKAEHLLKSRNIVYQSFDKLKGDSGNLILVGNLSVSEFLADDWKNLYKYIALGNTAIFLSPAAFKRGDDSSDWLPFENKGKCNWFFDWLYHKECVATEHPYFSGMQCNGILDNDYYGRVIPNHLFCGQDKPDEVISVAFAVGYPGITDGYISGILLGAYKLGAGKIVINTFNILENLGLNPAADRLLLNMIHEEQNNQLAAAL